MLKAKNNVVNPKIVEDAPVTLPDCADTTSLATVGISVTPTKITINPPTSSPNIFVKPHKFILGIIFEKLYIGLCFFTSKMEEKQLISTYNESGFQISRLHNHWTQLCKFRELKDWTKVKGKLDSIELELRYDAKMLGDNFIDKLDKLNADIRTNFMKIGIRRANPRAEKTSALFILDELEILFFKKECLLRDIQQQSGKGMKYKDIEEDDFF